MKQRAAKCADDNSSSTVFNLSSKKRKNGKILIEALNYLKDMGINSLLLSWSYSSLAVCRVRSVTILSSIQQMKTNQKLYCILILDAPKNNIAGFQISMKNRYLSQMPKKFAQSLRTLFK